MLSLITTYGLMMLYYMMFFLAVTTGYKNGNGRLKDVLSGKRDTDVLLRRMISGMFLLGIATVTIFTIRKIDIEIFAFAWNDYQLPVWLLIVAALSTGILTAGKKMFPAISSYHSLPSHLPYLFVMIRTLFLIVYEFFFRGAMLFVMIEDFGAEAAVVLNIILYSLVHWFDKKERYGSLFMGIVLCGISVYYHSVWPAIFIHLSLALSHEITLLINNKSLIKK